MTDTAYLAARSTELSSDTQSMPPFRRVDELDKAIAELDEWCSSFIGRITPYCHDGPTAPMATRLAPSATEEKFSPFEVRLIHARDRVLAITDALDGMNQRLHL